jgi:trimeric autotransporter adhesin
MTATAIVRCAIRKVAVRAILSGTMASIAACNGGGSGTPPPPPPSISIKSVSAFYAGNGFLSLPYAIAGQGAFILLVNGSGFSNSSVVKWGGNALPTTFGDSTDLSAAVSISLIATPGTVSVTVSDSGATSNTVAFGIASPATATAGVIAFVTAAQDGSPASGNTSVLPSISATGRYVAFQSDATNLAPGPASGFAEIYERDTCVGAPPGCTPTTTRATVTSDGSPVNANSRSSAISADGRYVAFDSSATNILPNSGICGQQPGLSCVFVRDMCIGASACASTTVAVSVDIQGSIEPGGGPQMSPDARYVSFGSSTSRLGVGSGTVDDVFVRDTCIGAPSGCIPSNVLASVPTDGSQGNQNSQLQGISASGRFVGFLSWATNMVPNETVTPGIFWRDACIGAASSCTGTTIRVDVNNSGAQPNQSAAFGPFTSISGDGRLVAFGSGATNLVSIAVPTPFGGVYVHDTCTGAASGCTPSTSLVSVANDGSIGNCNGGSPSQGLAMTPDGRFVAFDSIATDLTPDDGFPACSFEDVFVRDTCFGAPSGCAPSTVRASVLNVPNPGISGNSISGVPAISADGHYVVFISGATNLVPGMQGNGHGMVYLAKTGF